MFAETSVQLFELLERGALCGEVHSVFSKAINVRVGEDLFSILSPRALREPMALRLGEDLPFLALGLRPGQSVRLERTSLHLGTLYIPLRLTAPWDETLHLASPPTMESARYAFDFMYTCLCNADTLGGFAALFRVKSAKNSGIKENFYKKYISQVLHARTKYEILSCLKDLMGLGPGLTPAGDDFLCGFILTDLLFGSTTDYAQMLEELSDRTTPLSMKSLRLAARGRAADEFNLLLAALFAENTDRSAASLHAGRVASYGSSSGTDLLTGILFAAAKQLGMESVL